jgi:phosphoadenosine phosphosulfate reductase
MIDLWGNVDPHIQHSIALLKNNEPSEGYYLAFSGGKDSIVCYHLCKQAEVKFDAHYMRAMEPPEIVYFIRKHYPDVIRHLPKRTMWAGIKAHGIFPLRTIRWCCSEIKEVGGKNRTVVTGIRREESSARANRQEVAQVGKKLMVSPILHWTSQQVWDYIKNNNLSYPSLYDEGFKRVGCVMCPCGGPKQMRLEAKRWPKIAEAYRRAGNRFFDPSLANTWKSGDDMYEWWISGKTFGEEPTLWEESKWEESELEESDI